jgi:hypothetical protein
MLVTFKSSATPDLQMLENHANYLLGIAGKHLSERGVIIYTEMPGMIARLEAAIAADKDTATEHEAHLAASTAPHHDHYDDTAWVGLAQRAFPFLDMLRASYRAHADILWGI